MQATQEPKSTQAKNAANSHDPILTDEDEAFLRQVMSQPENAEPGASTTAAAPAGGSGGDGGDAVPAAASPPPENTQEIEEFGKSLGEQQRRATSELKEGGGEGKKDEKEDKKEDKKEDEGKKDEGDAEKKKKRWSVNWPWKKGQKEKVGRRICFCLRKILTVCRRKKKQTKPRRTTRPPTQSLRRIPPMRSRRPSLTRKPRQKREKAKQEQVQTTTICLKSWSS